MNLYFISAINLSKSKILSIIHNQLNNQFSFKTSYLNRIIKPLNGELSKIQKNSREFKIYFITALQLIKKTTLKFHVILIKKILDPILKHFYLKY